jgi:hypothetical protein
VPAQQIGSEWRFLKAALLQWLHFGPAHKPGSKQVVRKHVGVFKDDSDLEETLASLAAMR